LSSPPPKGAACRVTCKDEHLYFFVVIIKQEEIMQHDNSHEYKFAPSKPLILFLIGLLMLIGMLIGKIGSEYLLSLMLGQAGSYRISFLYEYKRYFYLTCLAPFIFISLRYLLPQLLTNFVLTPRFLIKNCIIKKDTMDLVAVLDQTQYNFLLFSIIKLTTKDKSHPVIYIALISADVAKNVFDLINHFAQNSFVEHSLSKYDGDNLFLRRIRDEKYKNLKFENVDVDSSKGKSPLELD